MEKVKKLLEQIHPRVIKRDIGRVTKYAPFSTHVQPSHFEKNGTGLSESALVKKKGLNVFYGGELLR